MHHFAVAQPVEQLVAVGRAQNRSQRVSAVRFDVAGGDHQQVQVVIAEHGDRARAEAFHEAQHRQRMRAAVDEIADQPQAVARRIEAALVEQTAQRRVTALDVTDCVSSQEIP